jgi:hypothetical protein
MKSPGDEHSLSVRFDFHNDDPSFFHQGAESIERRVPLPRYLIQVPLYTGKVVRAQLPDGFPASSRDPRQPGLLQGMQVFRDRLARNRRSGRQPRNRQRPFLAESSDDAQTRPITEGGEDERNVGSFLGGGKGRSRHASIFRVQREIFLDELHLRAPALLVGGKGLGTPLQGNPVEP